MKTKLLKIYRRHPGKVNELIGKAKDTDISRQEISRIIYRIDNETIDNLKILGKNYAKAVVVAVPLAIIYRDFTSKFPTFPFYQSAGDLVSVLAGFCAGTMTLREISNYVLMKGRFLIDSEMNRKTKAERTSQSQGLIEKVESSQ
ncbi:MAG: hypothetical protein AABW79_01515 [Nanoarchaeota archaeon]